MEKPKTEEKIKNFEEFESRQNATGFFSVLLEVVMKNPELRKRVFDKTDKDD